MDPTIILLIMAMTLAGAGIGVLSGLAPGIHVNTLASMLLVSYPAFESALSGFAPGCAATAACCCVMSASVVHSFVDFVPSVFIGAPDGEDAVSVLPGHRLLLHGRGMAAVRSAAIGSLVGASAAILLSIPFQVLLSGDAGHVLDSLTPVVLAIAVFTILFTERRRLPWAATALLISGGLGYACMEMEIPSSGILGEGTLLFPLLTGLFGFPVLLEASGSQRLPPQMDSDTDPSGVLPGLKGVVMGCVAGWFPGITSTVGATMSACVMPEGRPERFIASVASVGTVTSVLSLVALSASDSGRSGTAVVIGEIAGNSLHGIMSDAFMALLLSTAVASVLGYWLTIASGMMMSRVASGVRPDRLGRAVIVTTSILVLALTGPFGLLILACSVLVGFLPQRLDVGRTVLTGCLILPSLFSSFTMRVYHH